MSARTPNRRGVLAGLAAAPFAAVSAMSADNPRISVTSADQSVDDAFRRWLAGVQAYNSKESGPKDDEEIAWASRRFLDEPEAALYALPPSPMAAAACALLDLSYNVFGDEPLAEDRSAGRALLRVVACLRPFLTGLVSEVANDLLDTADRPYDECLLSRCIRGEPLPGERRDAPTT